MDGDTLGRRAARIRVADMCRFCLSKDNLSTFESQEIEFRMQLNEQSVGGPMKNCMPMYICGACLHHQKLWTVFRDRRNVCMNAVHRYKFHGGAFPPSIDKRDMENLPICKAMKQAIFGRVSDSDPECDEYDSMSDTTSSSSDEENSNPPDDDEANMSIDDNGEPTFNGVREYTESDDEEAGMVPQNPTDVNAEAMTSACGGCN